MSQSFIQTQKLLPKHHASRDKSPMVPPTSKAPPTSPSSASSDAAQDTSQEGTYSSKARAIVKAQFSEEPSLLESGEKAPSIQNVFANRHINFARKGVTCRLLVVLLV